MPGESRNRWARVFPPESRELVPRGAHGDFVGRIREIRRLEETVDASLGGRGQVVMLAGEAGIGKTRTAEEVAGAARARGACVVVGRCYEDEGTPAYWPWVQIIRSYAETHDDPWCGATEAETDAVTTLIAAVQGQADDARPAAQDPGTTARFRLFDGIAAFFKRIAGGQCVLVVVDDLHCADRASLLLLQFVAREIGDHHVMIVGTYRDTEVGPEHPLGETLSELGRHSHYQHMLLKGLEEAEVSQLIEQIAGERPAIPVVARVHAATEGNPFFVSEMVRLLATHGALADAAEARRHTLAVPDGVRTVVSHRLRRLSPECYDALTTAAVIGRSFSSSLLGKLTDLPADRLLDVLDEAVRARVLTSSPGVLAHYAFAHALIRETLCTSLDPSRRVHLHQEIGDAQEAMGDPEGQLSELAYHFYEAAPGHGVDKALDYAARAAQRAVGALAYEDAVVQYERALQMLDAKAPMDLARRCDLLLGLGTAETKAGGWQKGRKTFEQAAEIARRLADAERLARAALGSAMWGTNTVSSSVVSLLEEALVAVGEDDGRLRALLLAHLVRVLYFGDCATRRTALSREAVAMARRLGDPRTLAEVVSLQRFALWGPASPEERLVASSEVIELAARTADPELGFTGHAYRVVDRFEMGDVRGAEADVAACARFGKELGQPPSHVWMLDVWRTSKALFEGRFQEAERLIQQASPLASRSGDESALMCLGLQLVALHRESGLEGMDAPLAAAIEQHPEFPILHVQLAWIHAELGQEAEASRHFASLAATDFALRQDFCWLAEMVMLADVCAFLGDARHAATLYAQLLPSARRNATLAIAVYCYGAVAHYLGRLAATMGRMDDAARHFEEALALNAQMGTAPNVARTEHAYARMLLARGRPEDRARATELLTHALDTAQRLGMKTLVERIASVPAEVGEVPPPTDLETTYRAYTPAPGG